MHLKVHSAYSLLEGAITTPKLAKLALAHGYPAVGLTDTNNLFGALEFSDKLADSRRPADRRLHAAGRLRRPRQATSAAQRRQPAALAAAPARWRSRLRRAGWQNLMKLSSQAFFDPGEDEAPAHRDRAAGVRTARA